MVHIDKNECTDAPGTSLSGHYGIFTWFLKVGAFRHTLQALNAPKLKYALAGVFLISTLNAQQAI
jgi:hypothetical protein